MKFFLDENISISVVNFIKILGFEVEHARTAGLSGATDKEISEYAKKNKAILVTKDLEFGNILIYPEKSHHGLLILRLPNYYKTAQLVKILVNFLENIKPKILESAITILEVGRYRIRRF
ncbi:DUF5615 family PIN-like protein [Candidatus Woesearchaeota archaeon]|nr:DUF5615 family PIN-like protein [Candidatus Woesearchaeota archaeon]